MTSNNQLIIDLLISENAGSWSFYLRMSQNLKKKDSIMNSTKLNKDKFNISSKGQILDAAVKAPFEMPTSHVGVCRFES